jgi:hypothetical protein
LFAGPFAICPANKLLEQAGCQIVNRVCLAIRVPAINLDVERHYRNPNVKFYGEKPY